MVIESFKTKHDLLLNRLRDKIISGVYPNGSKLPVEVALAQQLQVSRDTLRKVLRVLENEGLLIRVRSKGTFVNYTSELKRRKILVFVKPTAEEDITYQCHFLMPGMMETAKHHGFQLEIVPRTHIEDSDIEGCATELNQDKELLGCVLFEGLYIGNENFIKVLQHAQLPVVMAVCHQHDVETTGFAGVRCDLRSAWLDGLTLLERHGHKRIAIQYEQWVPGFYFDFRQLYNCLKKRNLYDEELMCDTLFDQKTVERDLKRLFSLNDPPTAIYCRSDFHAAIVKKIAKRLGIRVPEDLEVMGFYGNIMGNIQKLPTVDFNYDIIGKKVIETLANYRLWFNVPEITPPEIIVPHRVMEKIPLPLNHSAVDIVRSQNYV